ncbi:LPPRC-like protein [Mya arenaria]|uniref:LPPRC-like protein n=1 Tax=Mya arenaria TaxID=6604 RepID=A0ABY7FCI4_MYAAR|nr:LPPRC-like protein [Mya arenaria]
MAALCRYSRFSVVLNHALRHSRNISLINNVDEKIYKNCITPISDRSSPYSPTSLQRLYSTGSSSSEVGKNAELRTEASKNEQKTEAQLEKGTEASENILTPEAQLEESIEISENAQKTKAQLEESTEASETVQKPAVLIEESIKASETVQKPAALFEESIKASETVQKPAALFEESIKASENGQKTHDKVQEIETSKVRNVSAFANQNVGYTLFMEDNFLDTRNKNLPNLKINNVEYPSDFPASEYWRRYRFDEECEWTAVEREIQKCDKMGKFLSLRFFNLVMRCALFKGHSYSIRYYNALLKVMLEHKTDFSVVDFLARLEKAGVAPNRVTLGRCLMKYCRSGNMDAANEILEHMKATETLITKKVYLSIMSGHFAAGRVGFGLEQTAFHEAIIGNMLADNREGVVKLFEDAKEADFELSEQALCQLIESAAVYDRPEYCELFLEKLKGTSNHYYNRGLETLIPLLRRESAVGLLPHLQREGLYLSWNSLKSLGLASEGEKITSLDKIRFADMPLEELKKRMIHFLHMFSFRRELLIKSSRAKDFELFEKVLSYKTKNDPKDIYVEGVKRKRSIHLLGGHEAIDALTLRQKDFQNPNVKITLSLPSFLMNLEPTAENCQLVQRLVSTAREYNLKFTFEDMITFLASSGDKEQVLAGLQMYHTSKNVNVTCGRLLMIAFKPFLDNRKDLQNVYEKLSQKFNENLTQGLHIDHKVMTPIFLKWREEDKNVRKQRSMAQKIVHVFEFNMFLIFMQTFEVVKMCK